MNFGDFPTLVLSILVEAFPFLILGVALSVFINVFINWDTISRLIPKNRFLSHLMMPFIGVFFPVCECGNIPVARNLIQKGFSVSQTITFLFSAPILNPITIYATLEAFNVDRNVAIIRSFSGFLIAVCLGVLVSFKKDQSEFLTEKFYNQYCRVGERPIPKKNWGYISNLFVTEFFAVFNMLAVGALLAGVFQVIIPKEVLLSIGNNPVLSILAMMGLAFLISICSNVDAFFALSYVNTFTLGSLMAFLTFGPLVDIKIIAMLKSVFKVKFLFTLVLIVFLLTFALGLGVNIFYKQFLF